MSKQEEEEQGNDDGDSRKSWSCFIGKEEGRHEAGDRLAVCLPANENVYSCKEEKLEAVHV